MKNLGDPPVSEEYKNLACAELKQAGAPRGSIILISMEKDLNDPFGWNGHKDPNWEVVYTIRAKCYGWKFERAWYYWRACCDSSELKIPADVAHKFNKVHGGDVRVDGYAGGKEITGPVNSYHIDSQEGLTAFFSLIKSRYEERYND